MNQSRLVSRLFIAVLLFGSTVLCSAGTWSDRFLDKTLGADWQGDREYFSIVDGTLKGVSAHPIAPVPLRRVVVGKNWTDYRVECRLNVILPNLLVCTTGALILRDNGTDGYVFALHVATGTIEVYRLSNKEMLFSKVAPLELKRWYHLAAELNGPLMKFFVDGELVATLTDDRSPSGAVGVAVQDVLDARFDDFTVAGPGIPSNGVELSLGPRVTITWPSALTNYVLKASSQLSPAAAWDTVTNVPTSTGDYRTVTLDRSTGSQFYILMPADR